MASKRADKIFPHFWYVSEAEEAARFYCSIFPDSRVERVVPIPVDTPSGPAGSVKVVDFTLLGQRFQAISAGPLDPFNHAISMVVLCEDQAEIDRYWSGLLQGGREEQCGWLRDRYGVCWQIVPRSMDEMMADEDLTRARRVANAMLKMVKLDIAKLQAAYEGR
jgi:predicted 3-demethylubiquinone-9 3-methyltransferase (glyoxalase superfamily)